MRNSIAQFGRGTFDSFGNAMMAGREARIQNKMLEEEQTAAAEAAKKQAEAERVAGLQAEREHWRSVAPTILSAPPEKQQGMWSLARQQAQEFGFDVSNDPEMFDDSIRSALELAAGSDDSASTARPVLIEGPNGPEWSDADKASGKRAYVQQSSVKPVQVLKDGRVVWMDPTKAIGYEAYVAPVSKPKPGALVKVVGPDGNPKFATPEEAVNMTPWVAPTQPKKPTGSEQSAAGFLERMKSAETRLADLEGYVPTSTSETLLGQTNVTASPKFQLYKQAANDWIRAKLRKESGAVIGEQEMADEYKTYFPIYGDSPEVIAQKAAAREDAKRQMEIGSGGMATASDGAPNPGEVVDGYVFMGGDPGNPASWKKAQ